MKLCKGTSQDRDEAKSKLGQAVALAAGIFHVFPQAPPPTTAEEPLPLESWEWAIQIAQ